nr:ribonuclease H-like domain-containing protein [Tanacetum cinerariifolium]
MSLDDLYNHLKAYESEVQKKSEPNSQNMAFISLAKHSRGNEDVNFASVSTASTNVPTVSANIGVASISQDTTCAYIAFQSSGSQIKFEDINQINEDDMEEMDIKWSMALLSMRADKFWKKTRKKISIQGSDVAGFDKSNVECFNYHKMGHFARECRAPRSQDRGRRDNYRQGGLEFRTESSNDYIEILKKKLETLKKEKEGVDGKLASFLTTSKDLDNLIESQRSDKNKEGLGYSAVPPPPAQIYTSLKKDLSWSGLPEFTDDTVTDYSRPSPTMESKTETPKKPLVKYAEQYRKPNKKPNVRGNQRNWNNLKSHQLGPNFVMKKKACFNCGDFNHLAYDCRKRVKKGASRSQNNTHESFTPRPIVHRPYRPLVKPMRTNMNGARPNKTSFNKQAHSKFSTGGTKFSTADMGKKGKAGSSQNNIDDKGYWDSDCSRHMTGNISYLSNYEPFDGGYVSFGQEGCKITGKGTIKTGKLKFKNMYFVKDLKYNLFSVSQICDNKNSVLFTDSECIVLGRDFKLLDNANILLRTPKQHNMYSIDLNNIVPHKDLTCLVAKASADECMLWHRRLGS